MLPLPQEWEVSDWLTTDAELSCAALSRGRRQGDWDKDMAAINSWVQGGTWG